MSTDTTAAPAAEMTESEIDTAFEAMAAERYDATKDPVAPVALAEEPIVEEAAAVLAAAEVPAIAAAAPAPVVTDIWSNAPADLRSARDAELAQRDQKYRSDIGRQAAYQSRISALEAELAGRTATPAAAPAATAEAPVALRERPAIKEALEGYPEVVGPLLDAFEPVLAENARMGRELSTLSEDRRSGVIATQEQALTAAHPDWQAACGSKDFADWLTVQPAAIKQIVERNGTQVVDAAEAIAMVGSFKAHWALTHPATPTPVVATAPAPTDLTARRAAQLAAVTGTPKGAVTAVADGAPNGQEDALFNHFAAKKAQKG